MKKLGDRIATFYVLNNGQYENAINQMMLYLEMIIRGNLVEHRGSYERIFSDCIEIKMNGGNITIDEYRKRNNLDDWIGGKDEVAK